MYKDLICKQRDLLNSNITNSYMYRLDVLKRLKQEIIKNEEEIKEALFLDLNKDGTESYLTEISLVLSELTYLIKNLKKLMKPKKVKTPLQLFPAKSYIVPEKLGIVLVISPWNYPFLLSFNPLVGAIATGNSVILKPSEYSINTNLIINKIINNVINDHLVSIVEGEVKETNELLENKFDYIFFTGSTEVGRIIMNKASNHLTPVTLELGGKSPIVIYKDTNLKLAVKRLVFGKLINAGQTCIAPDYLMLEESLYKEFIKHYNNYLEEFYNNEFFNNDSYPKIITNKHYERLISLLENEEVVLGGKYSNQKIEPTLVIVNRHNSRIMTEEIFGPILPIILFNDKNYPINYLKNKEKPLASYVFTNNKDIKNKFINETSSGSLVFNDTIVQFSNGNLPFGGVGSSGMGKYHGKYTFDTFSHYKAILDKKMYLDVNIRYHPYDRKKENLLKKFIK